MRAAVPWGTLSGRSSRTEGTRAGSRLGLAIDAAQSHLYVAEDGASGADVCALTLDANGDVTGTAPGPPIPTGGVSPNMLSVR